MANSELTGCWAVVTGSSSGIGKAIAQALANRGAQVIVHGFRQPTVVQELARELCGARQDARALHGDLSSAAVRAKIVEQAWEIAPLDIWINNAGADVLTGGAADASFAAKLRQLWEVDVQATIELSRAVGARMRDRGRGVILNMGWDQALTGMAGDSGEMFAATKGAIMAFSQSLAKSLAPQVRVNCLAPGWIKTAWGAQASDIWQQRAVEHSLLGRWGTPTDVAEAACYLVSPRAAFITGQIFNINGGH